MARPRKSSASGAASGVAPWMITYSDLMTLLLTFFVLMISMSQIDERRVRDFLISTRGDTSFGEGIFNPLSKQDSQASVQPGPMDTGELEFVREMIWEDKNLDLNLETNRYVAIISIGEDTLFPAGSSRLSPEGKSLLDRLSPQIQGLGYPMLVAGHTSTLREESQQDYYDVRMRIEPDSINLTWKLSMARALAVYEYFHAKNLEGLEISNEGFGEYRPKLSNDTPEGRQTNRRVDIVLDRRNPRELSGLPQEEVEQPSNVYEIDAYRFHLDVPGQPQNQEQMLPTPAGSEQLIPIVRPDAASPQGATSASPDEPGGK